MLSPEREAISRLLRDTPVPRMARVRQKFAADPIDPDSIPERLRQQLQAAEISGLIRPGMRVAVTSGSRGVANIAAITRTVVDFIKSRGADPFIVPAMGSHGGATAAGQTAVLAHYGITEAAMGCPVRATMEVRQMGSTEEGLPVYLDKYAAAADGIVVVCRVKAHTAFTGPVESGIMKMLAIGLGNDAGATVCHQTGYRHFSRIIPQVGQVVIEQAPVLFAVAAVENAFEQTARLAVVPGLEAARQEPLLLREAKGMMPRLYFDACDLLIVDRIGKDISGAGMDPHVTGTFSTPYAKGGIKAQYVAVLDLTEASDGNAIGVGEADVTTRRLADKIIPAPGYANAIVSGMLSTCKLPMILESDREAIQACLRCCVDIDRDHPRVIRIRDTLHLEEIMVSEALLAEAAAHPQIEILGQPQELPFDQAGNLF